MGMDNKYNNIDCFNANVSLNELLKLLNIKYMKKKATILIFLSINITLFAQQIDSTLVKQISNINNNVLQLQQEVGVLSNKLKNQQYIIGKQNKFIENLQTENKNLKHYIDSIGKLVQINSQNIVTNSKELGTKIQETGQKADTKIAELDRNVEKNRLYWLFVAMGTLLFGGLIYWLLSKRIKSSKTDVEAQIRKTKQSLEEESIKLDNKLIEVLEKQLKLQQEINRSQQVANNEKEDHSLALKVADEIVRIQKNLSRMDEKTKGVKQLKASVKRIQDNFEANGYEIVDMLGKEYNDGMKVIANFIPSDKIETGKEIITRIIKPQVNYKGKMIQAAQIEVSVGE